MSTLSDWSDTLIRELDLADAVDRATLQNLVLDLAKDAAHNVARPAAPLTTYLLGVAVGRSADPAAAAVHLAAAVRRLAESWGAEPAS